MREQRVKTFENLKILNFENLTNCKTRTRARKYKDAEARARTLKSRVQSQWVKITFQSQLEFPNVCLTNFGRLLILSKYFRKKIGVQSLNVIKITFGSLSEIIMIFAHCAENKRVKIVIVLRLSINHTFFLLHFLCFLLFQIAFHELNPFPMRTITHKREHHYKLLEVKMKHFF